MQISPAPPLPQSSAAATQPQAVQSNLHHLASQASSPISQEAIAPTTKSEKTAKTRAKDNKEPRDPEDRRKKKEKSKRGESVNISI